MVFVGSWKTVKDSSLYSVYCATNNLPLLRNFAYLVPKIMKYQPASKSISIVCVEETEIKF